MLNTSNNKLIELNKELIIHFDNYKEDIDYDQKNDDLDILNSTILEIHNLFKNINITYPSSFSDSFKLEYAYRNIVEITSDKLLLLQNYIDNYQLFFIYGTLKNNLSNNHILNDSIFIKNTQTKNKYPLFLLNDPFPYLQDNIDIGNIINGELWLVKNDRIYNLDTFEGVPDLYKKGTIDTIDTTAANVYFKRYNINLKYLTLLNEFKEEF